jgi:hypothetical protein
VRRQITVFVDTAKERTVISANAITRLSDTVDGLVTDRVFIDGRESRTPTVACAELHQLRFNLNLNQYQ